MRARVLFVGNLRFITSRKLYSSVYLTCIGDDYQIVNDILGKLRPAISNSIYLGGGAGGRVWVRLGRIRFFREKGSDKNIPMLSNVFIFILRCRPKIVILRAAVGPRAASLRPLTQTISTAMIIRTSVSSPDL